MGLDDYVQERMPAKDLVVLQRLLEAGLHTQALA
jgi:hypothetical protein